MGVRLPSGDKHGVLFRAHAVFRTSELQRQVPLRRRHGSVPREADEGRLLPGERRGFYDMHGNVNQWCKDWYDRDYYLHSETRDPAGPEGGQDRVMRGGPWYAK